MIENRNDSNLTDKPLRQFAEGDTLYIQRIGKGSLITLYCEFIRLDRGSVTAKVVSVWPDWAKRFTPEVVRARASKCYLWGPNRDNSGPLSRCHWFKDLDSPAS